MFHAWFAHLAHETGRENPFVDPAVLQEYADANYKVYYELMDLSLDVPENNALVFPLYDAFHADYVAPLFPGIADCVRLLAHEGFGQAVFTTNSEPKVRAALAAGGIDHHVGLIVGNETLGRQHRKPEPQGLLLVMKQLNATPGRTVYIGDTPSDLIAAKNAGDVLGAPIRTVAATYGWASAERMRAMKADAYADHPSQLYAAIEEAFSRSA